MAYVGSFMSDSSHRKNQEKVDVQWNITNQFDHDTWKHNSPLLIKCPVQTVQMSVFK